MFYSIGIGITFFLVLILISKKNKSTADTILTAWLFIIGTHLLLYYLYVTKQYVSFPYLLGIEISMPLLHGPLLYLYTNALTSRQKASKMHFLHFLPYFISLLFLIPFFNLTQQQKILVYVEEGKGQEVLMECMFVSIVISGIAYMFFVLRKLYYHRGIIESEFSTVEKINLKWLYYLVLGLSMIWMLVIFGKDEHVFYAVVLYVIFIGYFGMQQTEIFINKQIPVYNYLSGGSINNPAVHFVSEENPSVAIDVPIYTEHKTKSEKVKYEKTKLNLDELLVIQKKVTNLVENEKVFKNPDLTLTELAQKVEVHPNILSQMINSLEEKNFYDFINELRIEEFKQMVVLPQNQKFTLLALAFECGFNSKTSFNRNFKKITNHSPSEYLKQINIRLN